MPLTHRTVAQAAAELCVSIPHTLALIHSKQLDAVNIAINPLGKPAWRIPADAVQRFLEARANPKPVRAMRRRRTAAVREWV